MFLPVRAKKNEPRRFSPILREVPSIKDLIPSQDEALKELQFQQNMNYLNYLES